MTLVAAATLVGTPALGQQPQTGFLNRTIADGNVTRRYQVYVPADYTPGKRWPVILFLHGGGAQGDDGLVQTEGAVGSAIRRSPHVAPSSSSQVGRGGAGAGTTPLGLAALEATERSSPPTARVYLTGCLVAAPGRGTWPAGIRPLRRRADRLRRRAVGGRPS
jgi:fermentation-respiration switch protein FrsA (DUF1100 family)